MLTGTQRPHQSLHGPNGAAGAPLARSDRQGAAYRLHFVSIASGSPTPAAGSGAAVPARAAAPPPGAASRRVRQRSPSGGSADPKDERAPPRDKGSSAAPPRPRALPRVDDGSLSCCRADGSAGSNAVKLGLTRHASRRGNSGESRSARGGDNDTEFGTRVCLTPVRIERVSRFARNEPREAADWRRAQRS